MLIDLSKKSGLNLKFNPQDNSLIFPSDVSKVAPAVRTIDQMRQVLYDKSINNPSELYYMYRGIRRDEDKKLIDDNNLRYDITVIKPDRLGEEFMKTQGHYHPGKFPELYEVLVGVAWCLLQRPQEDDHRLIKDVILVKAKEGEKIVCLPGYGHILINPRTTHLIMANWVSRKFNSEYELYQKSGGAAYFLIEEIKDFRLIPNSYFGKLPPLKIMTGRPEIKSFGISKGKPIYPILKEIEKLDFLNNPGRYDFSDLFIDVNY